MAKQQGARFAAANIGKLLRVPLYLIGYLVCLIVPRSKNLWVFGSQAGFGEGAKPVALRLQASDSEARAVWLAQDAQIAAEAKRAGIEAVSRRSLKGFWVTVRAAQIIVTHGLGDVNRYGVFGGSTTQLWHGAPLKRLHFDSPVTTSFNGPRLFKRLLLAMYRRGSSEISLYTAGSVTAARRLRSAFRVLPGRVEVTGDPRHDELFATLSDALLLEEKREQIQELVGIVGSEERLVLFAPTWRDGASDPQGPDQLAARELARVLKARGAKLLVRTHPLGAGDYRYLLEQDGVYELGSDKLRDITPSLAVFDAVITDYSSIALDFAVTGKPVLFFAPDLGEYTRVRGLYEPLELTANNRLQRSWQELTAELGEVLAAEPAYLAAAALATDLAARFHTWRDGDSATRVIAAIKRLSAAAADLVPEPCVFFESFYGKQVSDNPLALAAEITAQRPKLKHYWSVTDESQQVPQGATAVLEGSVTWHAARNQAQLVVVNDWLRHGFKRRKGQMVLQTWHGTMLKNLALARPDTSLRTRLAVRRESRRWTLLLSQNPHSSAHFRQAYAYRGEILELGYPRCDALARATVAPPVGSELDRASMLINPVLRKAARDRLGITTNLVVSYIPTWRHTLETVDTIQVAKLAAQLGEQWTIMTRSHTRSAGPGYALPGSGAKVIDVSRHPDINDVLVASDVVVTDYSSVMFDASVAGLPLLFFVTDIDSYRDRERGFSFDFAATAPGPLLKTRDSLWRHLVEFGKDGHQAAWIAEHREKYAAWRHTYNPRDDGYAAARVVSELITRGAL